MTAQRFWVRGRDARTREPVEFEAFEAVSLDMAVSKLNAAGIAVDQILPEHVARARAESAAAATIPPEPIAPPASAPVLPRPRGRVLTVRITPATQWRLTSAIAVGIIGGLTGFVLLWFFALSVLIGISQAARETPAFPGERSSWAAPPTPEPEWRRKPTPATTGQIVLLVVISAAAAGAAVHYIYWLRRERRRRRAAIYAANMGEAA